MGGRIGSCLCGEVRYSISSEPMAVRICWCKDCQKIAANGTVNILVPTESINHSGKLEQFVNMADSGDRMVRRFCPKCGTHLFSNSSTTPEFTVVRAGTLSDPSSIRPTMNIWVSSAPEWSCMDKDLESTDKQPIPPQRLK
ncbi:MAG: GFA family protein [Gammaproteobacteria bacterium]|nr:GFA family protein [Gammaproteobacteria bacterium]